MFESNPEQESRFFVFLALAIIVVSLILVSQMLLVRPPETYSEVYFDLGSLREKATFGEEIPVWFVVENHEGEGMKYTYKIFVGDKQANEGEFFLRNGKSKTVFESALLANKGKKQRIDVNVRNGLREDYNLFFWLEVAAP